MKASVRAAIWLVAAFGLGVALLVLGVLPVRAYVNQRAAIADAKDRVAVLTAGTDSLRAREEVLMTPQGIEATARSQYGMVRPGDRPLVITGLYPDGSAMLEERVNTPPPSALPDRLALGVGDDVWARLIKLLRSLAG